MVNPWDERFAEPGFAYGTEPNDFLRSVVDRLTKGPTLSIGEGEGRNAIFLAQRGFTVTAVDGSAVGLQKLRARAAELGLSIATVHTDLADYPIEEAAWSTIVSVFCHLPAPLRTRVHGEIARGLRPGGTLAVEAYTPAQLRFRTGGPPVAELMFTLDMLRGDFAGLTFEIGQELEREIHEGRLHDGHSAVVQVLARK